MLQGYSLPRTPDGRSSLAPRPPWHYTGEALAVEFRADAQAIAAYLPPGLTLASGERAGRCALYFCDWQFATDTGLEYLDPLSSQYRETILLMACERDGANVSFCPYIWVDQDLALMRGLIQGWPKQFGRTGMTRSYGMRSPAEPSASAGGCFGAALTFRERRVAEAQITLECPSHRLPDPGFASVFNVRHFPRLSAGRHDDPAVHELVQLRARDVSIENPMIGHASLTLFDHPGLELAAFTPLSVDQGFRMSVSLTVDDLQVIEDYTAQGR
ncbi:acetoacetate decarboxylase family protein [Trinickia acidisoli]|uniref:acetoacetate decarboxylase family protein n=1 Tax=Trinickia acidisoli TaxID=2767482 RepID=UPI001A8FF1CA|nr:acetoacetate decarboxylase family protein [Trinickia acidisoli]